MLQKSSTFVKWNEALQKHVRDVVPMMRAELDRFLEQQRRMQTPCLKHTRLFLKQYDIDINLPVASIVGELRELVTSTSEEQEKVHEIIDEWTHYTDIVYAHNVQQISSTAIFRANPFENEVNSLHLDELTNNRLWSRVPTNYLSHHGFKLRHFDMAPKLIEDGAKRKSDFKDQNPRKRAKTATTSATAKNDVNTTDAGDAKMLALDDQILQGFMQIVQNSSNSCMVHVLERVQFEMTRLNHRLMTMVRELPDAKSFYDTFLTPSKSMPPDPHSPDAVAPNVDIVDMTVEPDEDKKEAKLLVAPPDWDFLYGLCEAFVAYTVQCNWVAFGNDHRRFMHHCLHPLKTFVDASGSSNVETVLKGHLLIDEHVDSASYQKQVEEFEQGVSKRKLELATNRRRDVVREWLSQTVERSGKDGDIKTQIALLNQEEMAQAKIWFSKERQTQELRDGQPQQEALERMFEKEAAAMRKRWPCAQVAGFQELKSEFASILKLKTAAVHEFNVPFVALLGAFVDTSKKVERMLTMRTWALPEDVSLCIHDVCEADFDSSTAKRWSWHDWFNWLQKASFIIGWYETAAIFL